MRLTLFASLLAVASGLAGVSAADFAPAPDGRAPEIRTPPAPATPRINGPSVFGVRPKHPLLYHLPVTGDRPMEYAADSLPAGLTLDTNAADHSMRCKATKNFPTSNNCAIRCMRWV